MKGEGSGLRFEASSIGRFIEDFGTRTTTSIIIVIYSKIFNETIPYLDPRLLVRV